VPVVCQWVHLSRGTASTRRVTRSTRRVKELLVSYVGGPSELGPPTEGIALGASEVDGIKPEVRL
jgi:hypothetical protein